MSSRSGPSVSNEFALARILVLDDSGATVETLIQLLADGGYERVSGYTEAAAELGEARLEILERLVTVAEYRDNDTGVHARRVGLIAASLIESVGSSTEEATLVSHAATLHDIGKVGVPDRILLKPGKLTAEEF